MSWIPTPDHLTVILGVLTSLLVWGIVRSAIWILPFLFINETLPLAAASFLAFFSVLTWLAPHQKKAFDLRDFTKERWSLAFFMTGVIAGVLMFPPQVYSMAIAALIPLLACRLFDVLRLPPSRVLFLPSALRWGLLIGVVLIMAQRILAMRSA